MGCYTWTDCQKPNKSIGYDKKAYVICPDNTVIKEPWYEGYGEFGGKDIFSLVVDWNRSHLKDILDRKKNEDPKYWGNELYDIGIAAMESDEKAEEAAKKTKDNLPDYLFFASCGEWKRNIGITIAGEDKDNVTLPYPIKISSTLPKKPYSELPPSSGCQ